MRVPGRVSTWPGWELAGLSLLPAGQHWANSVSRTQANLQPGVWHCYQQVFGGHDGFFPHFAKRDAWRAARPRIALFRKALLRHTGLIHTEATPANLRHIVFSLRRSYRCIANEAEVVAAVRASPSLSSIVRFVNFADVTLKEQLALVLQASAVAGVHGQGLVWTSMLSSSEQRGCALLELMPKQMARVNSHSKYDYYRWTRLNECGYKSLIYPDTPECQGQYFRTCGNLTVDDVPNLVRELEKVQMHVTLEKRMATVSLS